MPGVDLNVVRNRLKSRKKVGVTREGTLEATDPGNDGSKPGSTTLQPTRFYD